MNSPLKIAAIITSYYPRSHADVIATKFMVGFPTDTGLIQPQTHLASMYIDQKHPNDIGFELSDQHEVPIYPSVVQALTLDGNDLAVDGVLLIGEHGNYAYNELGQHLYPRRYLFEQICGVFATSGRSVPVFCDKHLSYNWSDANWMYQRAKTLKIPLMAGSSLPLCWRHPYLEHPTETPITSALTIGYGGTESYGFHSLEAIQCMVERRAGGEKGVVSVQTLTGSNVWKAGNQGLWDLELARSASKTIENHHEGTLESTTNPTLFLIEHQDELKSAVLMLSTVGFAYACRVGSEIQATEFYLQQDNPYGHFSYLGLNIEQMFLSNKPQYPTERTLLTTGILEIAIQSLHRGGIRLDTPHLSHLSYQSYEKLPLRPVGPRPKGATLETWPPTCKLSF